MAIELTALSAAYLAFRLLPFLVATVLTLAPLLVFSWKGVPYLLALLVTLALTSVFGGPLGRLLEWTTSKLPSWQTTPSSQSLADVQEMQRTCAMFSLGGGITAGGAPAPLDMATLAFSTAYLMYFIERNDLGRAYRGVQVIMPIMIAAYGGFMAYKGCVSMGRGVAALAVGGIGGWMAGSIVAARFPGLAYLKAPPASGVTCVRAEDGILTCHGGDPNNSPDDDDDA